MHEGRARKQRYDEMRGAEDEMQVPVALRLLLGDMARVVDDRGHQCTAAELS